ncbi:protein painting of fourth isoform X1 [Drosophila pseudoobscura]|uniref:Protein painting of fourth isoform X1 n=1 Tax=Drosophila pseudoobscura pseudoobscura TaxID=46245 RepID=A0A6I8VGT8_DROPS|nr:protein painting of fourth isoform X1 [Drosophila pseudoobscura]
MDLKRCPPAIGIVSDSKRPKKNSQDKGIEIPGDGNPQNLPPCSPDNCSVSLPESHVSPKTAVGAQPGSWQAETINSDCDTASLSEFDRNSLWKKDIHGNKLSRREMARVRRMESLKCLELERELGSKSCEDTASVVLFIRFPDPEISTAMVAGLSPAIRDVGVPSQLEPRYCMVHLKIAADVESTISEINQVRFGNGFLVAERKEYSAEEEAKLIDPCSLYVSNIPFHMTTSAIKGFFVRSMRVDVGVLRTEKRARYAFVRYATTELAREAFRELSRSPCLSNRTLTVRFRRIKKRPGQFKLQPNPSNLTINTLATDDDDAADADCKVISPPPVESITISDSDGNCSDSNGATKEKAKRKSKMTEHEMEIQKLKLQMAEYGAIIKSLQARQDISADLSPKLEPSSYPEMCRHARVPTPVHLIQDIKAECAYLGLPEVTAEHEPAFRPTTLPIDKPGQNDDPKKTKKSFFLGRMLSGLARLAKSPKPADEKTTASKATQASPEKDARLEELYAQLETDLDT